jgi:HEAT repeat protein
VALWLQSQVLPAALAMQDADRVRPLIDRLGKSRDPRVLPILVEQLENVLSRADLVRALGELEHEGAIPALRERLLSDPYVHVRAAAATALGSLIARSDRARQALIAAQRSEREPAVRSAIATALSSPATAHP